jgi:hypothetical protein
VIGWLLGGPVVFGIVGILGWLTMKLKSVCEKDEVFHCDVFGFSVHLVSLAG